MKQFTREMSLEYRQNFTLPKTLKLKSLIKGVESLRGEQIKLQTAQELVALFSFLAKHPDEIIPDIHDLWSEYVFAQGYVYGEVRSDVKKVAPLLKPFAYFTIREQKLERMLVVGDMKALATAVLNCFSMVPEAVSHQDETFVAFEKRDIVNLALFLSQRDDFIIEASRLIHDNWRFVTAQLAWAVDDPRTIKSFDDLTDEERVITIENVKSDIEAVALYVASLLDNQ